MSLFIILFALLLIQVNAQYYTIIETGFVGVLYYSGEIQNKLLLPGRNWYSLLSEVKHIEIRRQSDVIKDVDCVTNEGLHLVFPNIEVGNQLNQEFVLNVVSVYGSEYDKYLVTDLIRHEINVICSKKTSQQITVDHFDQLDDLLKNFIQEENNKQKSGLIINFVRLTKPKLPPSIEKNYLALAEEKTLKKVVEERTHRIKTEKDSEMIVARKDNEIKVANVQNQNEMMILNMEAKRNEQIINNEMIIANARANAEKIKLEADALTSMYNIEGYTQVKIAESMSTNHKYYYGEKLPKYYVRELPE